MATRVFDGLTHVLLIIIIIIIIIGGEELTVGVLVSPRESTLLVGGCILCDA
jgi:hypothetical protein